MPFSIECKHTIKVLKEQKLYGATKVLRMFPNKNCTLSGVCTLLAASNVVRVVVGRTWLAVLIPPSLWPPNSQDLNPVNYTVWGILQEHVYKHHQITDVEELHQHVEGEWDRLELGQEVIENIISEWRKRLTACIAAGIGHFEHSL